MAISSPGIGSNLDINGIVSQLMAVEKQPLTKLARREAVYQSQISAYGNLKSALSSFQTAVSALGTTSKFQANTATPADATVLTASASSSAVPGTYSLNISKLAQAQSLVATGQASMTTAIGAAVNTTLTFDFGTISGGAFTAYNGVTGTGGTYAGSTFTSNGAGVKTVTISSTNNSLQGIRDSINNANVGVTATIVNDGGATPYRLALSSNSIGKTNSMKISVAGDATVAGLLGHDPAGTQNLKESATAQNAEFTANGIFVSKASNTITDVIQGVTLNLAKTTASATTLSVARDTASVTTSVNAFVKAYNDLTKTLTDLTYYDSKTKQSGPLNGDATARSIQSQLRSTIGSPLTGVSGSYTLLSQIGITSNKDGTLAVNATTLQNAINTNFNAVAGVFAEMGVPTDSLINYSGATSKTLPGTYAVSVSQVGTQGNAVAAAAATTHGNTIGSAAAGLTIDATNNTLNVTLDGVSSVVTLASGTYTAATLATEVQTAINADATFTAAGKSVTASQSNGVMSITSASTGALSNVSVTGGNGLTNLMGVPTTGPVTVVSAGVNDTLNLTINGVSASVTVAAGNYSAAALAAQLQSAINGTPAFSISGTSTTVSQSAGALTITSNNYGSGSSVTTAGGSGITDLLGGSAVSTTGLDTIGTINGVAATAAGQYLTGATGNAAEGLKIQVTGGVTGARGSVSYSQGYASKLGKLADTLLATTGTIATRTTGITSSITSLGKRRDSFNLRMVKVEENLRKQFTALDVMIGKMSTTSNFLTQQLGILSKTTTK
jgi:flagellar hook-associated protein 2